MEGDPNSLVGGRYGVGTYSNGRAYNYDPRNLLLSAVYPEGSESYTYDNVGNVSQKTDVNGVVTTYTYYDNNQLATVNVGGNTFTYTYDLAGRPATVTFPSSTGITLSFTTSAGATGWDNADRLLSMRYLKGATLVQGFEYTYDDSGNRVSMIEKAGASTIATWSYTYDWLNRLLSATRNGTTTNYTYDANNNRTVTGTTTAYDAGDQLTSLTSGSTTTFAYDRDGNLVSQVSGANTTNYQWNDFNNLYDLVVNGTSTMKAYYGADNIRRSRADGSKYFSSGSLSLSETRPTGAVSFIQGAGLLGLKQGGNFYYMLSDGLGSVRSIVDSSGNVTATNETDAYGVNLSSTGSAELRANTFTGALGVRDDANGLYYARNRYYNPQLGRWLSRDPIGYSGGDLSLYGYVGGNPTNAVDPSGLDSGLTGQGAAVFADALGLINRLGRVNPAYAGKAQALQSLDKMGLINVGDPSFFARPNIPVIADLISEAGTQAHTDTKIHLNPNLLSGCLSRDVKLRKKERLENAILLAGVLLHELDHMLNSEGLGMPNTPNEPRSYDVERAFYKAFSDYAAIFETKRSQFVYSVGQTREREILQRSDMKGKLPFFK